MNKSVYGLMKWIRRFFIYSVFLVFVGFIWLHFFSYKMIIQPPKRALSINLTKYSAVEKTFLTTDKIQLKLLELKPNKEKGKKLIILIHGIGGIKEDALDKANFLAEQGVTSILVDLRAHGKSGGQYCTYGFFEKQDLNELILALKKQYPRKKIGLWGQSMGAAIALQTAAHCPEVSFVVSESSFTDLSTIVSDYQKRLFAGIRIPWLSDYALNRAAVKAHFNPQTVSPLKACKVLDQPVLFVHGKLDKRIDISYAQALYKASVSSSKEAFLVDAHHNDVWQKGGLEYQEKLLEWMAGI